MDRITQLQQRHPWLTEDKARLLLVSYYKMNVEKLEALLQMALDHYVQQLIDSTEHDIRNQLAVIEEMIYLPPTTDEPDNPSTTT